MTSNQFTKRPPNIIQYLEHNLQESESDDDCELDDNCESDSGKSELDEEYYRLQPPPIPVDVLLANTVHLDRTYVNGVPLLHRNEDVNEHYEVWKNRETNNRNENSSSYTRVEIPNNVRPSVPVSDTNLCCTFLCSGIKSCCVLL